MKNFIFLLVEILKSFKILNVLFRCVDEKDKTASMGFGLMIMALFAFIPSPIFFGGLMDKYCILWGKTCSGKGNCWLYDNESLR